MPIIHYAISLGLNCRPKYHLRRAFHAASASGVFDWQVTPARTVMTYLEQDFRGMFELDELYVDAKHEVIHRTLGTKHAHEFPKDITDETLSRYYNQARSRHDYLCANLRRLLRETHPLLIVVGDDKDNELHQPTLEKVLRGINPHGTFHVLFAPKETSLGTEWWGDKAAWEQTLRPYTVPAIPMLRAHWQRFLRRRAAQLPRFAQTKSRGSGHHQVEAR